MKIEIVYALPQEQEILTMNVADDCTVDQALRQSGVFEKYSELSIETITVGVFSEVVELNHVLKSGDRIEIYRPLQIDPMEARRLRAKK